MSINRANVQIFESQLCMRKSMAVQVIHLVQYSNVKKLWTFINFKLKARENFILQLIDLALKFEWGVTA